MDRRDLMLVDVKARKWLKCVVMVVSIWALLASYYILGLAVPSAAKSGLGQNASIEGIFFIESRFGNDENSGTLPIELEKLVSRARSIKIYVPINTSNLENKYPGYLASFNESRELDVIRPYTSWYWIHSEYIGYLYMLHRSRHDSLTFTDDILQADLCYPFCDNTTEKYGGMHPLAVKMQVMQRSQAAFSGCKWIQISVEDRFSVKDVPSLCNFVVPYWHSIYAPSRHAAAPWSSTAERHILLGFIGGSWRGVGRARVIEEMQNISLADRRSTAEFDGRQRILFSAPFYFKSQGQEKGVWSTNNFYADVWALYAKSVFSWHPRGDSLTRRAFYDSWMMGCIPVISQTCAKSYRALFRGVAFAACGIAFEDVVVVLDDTSFNKGGAVLAKVASFPPEEVRRRQHALAALAPIMQWGYDAAGDRADALLMSIAAALAQ